MNKALIFDKDGVSTLVTAEEVKAGIYDPSEYEFVDPEYEFKVQFVRGSKNNGSPYFRLYYSYEDYKKLYPDRADRYEIVANMRRYYESLWHKTWKARVGSFCEIEKYTKDPDANKWKYADAFNPDTNTCIEFQHSYIALDFEERNDFYSNLGINVIWLYDLSNAHVCDKGNNCFEILEDNAKGFFRISEKPTNLTRCPVYIQVKTGMIYRVTELQRKRIDSEYNSTIRFFSPSETYTEDEFIDLLKREPAQPNSLKNLDDLWNSKYSWMIVLNTNNGKTVMINRDDRGHMFRSIYDMGAIMCKYVTCYSKDGSIHYRLNSDKSYPLSNVKAESKIWRLVTFKLRNPTT